MDEQKLLKRKRKAIAEDNKNLLVSACIGLAELHFREERYDAAIREYKTVSEIYLQQDKSLDYARVNRMIGEAYTHKREFNKALKHQEIHLGVAKEQGDKMEEQRALATIGHTYLTSYLDKIDEPDQRGLNLASRAFMKSLNICESLKGISKQEHMDMMARLFANLGIIQECQGDYEKGIELMKRSINICKLNDIYEQLYRGYIGLASIYVKINEYSSGIQQLNLAIEVAGRLDDKISLMCAALFTKSEILIKLSDFQGAKFVLLKAYKLKSPNHSERDSITNNLKVVAAMCDTEDSVLIASETDYKLRKKLYEKMGDGACILKNYSKAIEYYKKMLECAEKNGDANKDLSACFVSLAETYKDNEEYDLSIKFFKKEYDVCKDNLKESVCTIFNIVDVMDLAKKNLNDILMCLNNARKQCKISGDKHLEGKILSKYIAVLRKHNDTTNIESYENELIELDYNESESEGMDVEEITENIGDDIDLDNLTDVSDDSDNEAHSSKTRSTRKRNKTFVIKRNNKGETQLHTACIGGNAALVKKLLDQGHAVNVRDHCGWLPIHEACICGYLDIVKMLVEKGAAINDRGGTLCQGMTPLHDAASNGHFEIIEYMLENGALASAKTHDGETPFHVLKRWRKDVKLDPIEQTYYETLIKRMSTTLENVVQSKTDITCNKENKALVIEEDIYTSQNQPTQKRRVLKNREDGRKEKHIGKIGNLRKNIDNFDDDDTSNDSCNNDATNDYINIMDNLRNRPHEIKKRKSCDIAKRPALLAHNEVGEDWLDDDIGLNNKKRKTVDPFIELKKPNKTKKLIDRLDSNDYLDDFPELPAKHVRKQQSTLIKAGFTRKHNTSPTTVQNENSSLSINLSQNKKKAQTKLTSFTHTIVEPDSTTNLNHIKSQQQSAITNVTSNSTQNTLVNKFLPIDVRLEGKMFRIPVPANEIETLTLKWLADQVTTRYYKIEAIKPVVELETKNGAMLSQDDFINMLFPIGATQGEEVHAKVTKWDTPPLLERYKDACTCLSVGTDAKIIEFVEKATTSLEISNKKLRAKLLPLCKALNRQSNLYELNLSGNYMGDKSFELLCESFSTMSSLVILNLSSNHITSKAINYLSNTFKQHNQLLNNLVDLNLSYNPLCDESFNSLSVITHRLKLKQILLKHVDFTNNIFQNFYNRNLLLNLSFVESFDISYNKLCKEDVIKFISWLEPLNLKHINFGNNNITNQGLGVELAKFLNKNDFGFPNLKSINLCRCKINDEDTLELMRVLSSAKLNYLDLSFNDITSISLKEVIENTSLVKLNVSGCERLSENFVTAAWKMNVNMKQLISTLDYVEEYEQCDTLINLWKTEYNEKATIKGVELGMLHLNVID